MRDATLAPTLTAMRAHVLVFLMLLAPVAHAGKRGKHGKVIDRVAILVNGEPIFESDLVRRVKFGGTRDDAEAQLIDEALVLAFARQNQMKVDPDEVDLAIDEVEKQNGIDDAQLAAALQEQGMTLAEYRLDVERQLLVMRTRNALPITRGGDREAQIAAWIDEQRAHAFIDRRVKP